MENRKCRQNACLLLVTGVRRSRDRFLKIDHCIVDYFSFQRKFYETEATRTIFAVAYII